jgi:hypothetical protein
MSESQLGRAPGLRRQALLASGALIIEFVLGVSVNLYASIPRADSGSGVGRPENKVHNAAPAALVRTPEGD